jgi:hypothetical protein
MASDHSGAHDVCAGHTLSPGRGAGRWCAAHLGVRKCGLDSTPLPQSHSWLQVSHSPMGHSVHFPLQKVMGDEGPAPLYGPQLEDHSRNIGTFP